MKVLIAVNDLIMDSKICNRAESRGIAVAHLSAPESYAPLTPKDYDWVILGLSDFPEGSERLIKEIKKYSAAKILAFGPHVQKDILEAALRAGCDRVVPNSALEAALEELFSV